jgi:hypothetical protein
MPQKKCNDLKKLTNDVKNVLKMWNITTKNALKFFYFIWSMLST